MIQDLKKFGEAHGLQVKPQSEIAEEASHNIIHRHNYSTNQIKAKFDELLEETEKEAYRLYSQYEKQYGQALIKKFCENLIDSHSIKDPSILGEQLAKHFNALDTLYLSLAQSRKARAGKAFEVIHNSLFKSLSYPFDEQQVINGKPDFVMPSVEHYRKMPLECVVFTAKRTLRERWRQIVTEGTRGIGFYLATIDAEKSKAELREMIQHKIYLVVPESIKQRKYAET